MDHADHVALITEGVPVTARGAGSTWVDIGAGRGAFTLALAELLGPGSRLIAVDRDAAALSENARAVAARFPEVEHRTLVEDLTGPLDLPALDGIVAANVLHFIDPGKRVGVVAALAAHLLPGGRFLIVEYETSRPTPWLPYPLPFTAWEELAEAAGLADARRTGSNPRASAGGMYAATAVRAR